MEVKIVKADFLNEDGTFNMKDSLLLSGKFAGVCYDQEGYEHLKCEAEEKTLRRVNLTKDNGHHSVYGHIYLTLNITGIPKILAMVLNNEKDYNTSEKSARYTKLKPTEGSVISEKEYELYNKWMLILEEEITKMYGSTKKIGSDDLVFDERKIRKLAQENARYFITVFMPTTMVHTINLRQLNYIYSWFKEYIKYHDQNNDFENRLSLAMEEFNNSLLGLNLIDEGLIKNEKHRTISLFGKNLKDKEEYFKDTYATVYEASFAEVAQDQRHRTIYHQIERNADKKYFIPPIIADKEELVKLWCEDMKLVSDIYPQGELVTVYERGMVENFTLKLKERLCSAAQLEIANQNKNTLKKYFEAAVKEDPDLAIYLEGYTHGARCTFADFECSEKCMFLEGMNLTRKI